MSSVGPLVHYVHEDARQVTEAQIVPATEGMSDPGTQLYQPLLPPLSSGPGRPSPHVPICQGEAGICTLCSSPEIPPQEHAPVAGPLTRDLPRVPSLKQASIIPTRSC